VSLDDTAWERLVAPVAVDAAERALRARGVAAGHVVAWLGHNRAEQLADLAACRRLGAVLMPLNWRLAPPELMRLMAHAGAAHLVSAPETAGLAEAIRPALPAAPAPAEGLEPGDLLLVYTSGTTGEPKGALHTANGLLANAEAAIDAQGLGPDDRVLAVLPMFHVGGLCIQLLPALMAGGAAVLQPRFEPQAWFDAVEQQRPTTSLLVPAVMRALVDHPAWATADLRSLRFVCAGSQVVPATLIKAFHARGVPVAQVYGATETGPVSVVLRPEEARDHVGAVGRPARGVELRLADDGEILLRAPNLMRRYHRQAAPSFDAEGWFHTGDLAVRRDSGMLEVVGRSKELIISGGENIHPAELENLVHGRAGVAECALVGLPDERWGEVPVLAVVLQPGARHDEAALRAVWEDRVARFKHPRRVVVLDALPKTALGKVQRSALVAQLSA
jgi:fatty-acyl-CoA synthase